MIYKLDIMGLSGWICFSLF